MLQPSNKARFLAKVQEMPNGCHEWTASKNNDGYGNFGIGGTNWLAHRAAWHLWNGPIPDGLYVLHSCDNPPCVRLSHLWLGTQKENIRDMMAKGRRAGGLGAALLGERNGRAKLSDATAKELCADWAKRQMTRSGRVCPGENHRLATKYGVSTVTVWSIGTGRARGERTNHKTV